MKSQGILRYRSNWWIWLECDYELGRYLRRLYFLATHKVYKLGKPSWDEHITVVSSHEKTEKFEKYWNKHEGKIIDFSLDLFPQTNGNAWWFPIVSQTLEDIREELGLNRLRNIPLHFAVGYERMGKVYEFK